MDLVQVSDLDEAIWLSIGFLMQNRMSKVFFHRCFMIVICAQILGIIVIFKTNLCIG